MDWASYKPQGQDLLRVHKIGCTEDKPKFSVKEEIGMAFNFGPANEYNVFLFGDMSMSNTDAEGRVAVGGNAILSNYGLGRGFSLCLRQAPTRPLLSAETSAFQPGPTPAATLL